MSTHSRTSTVKISPDQTDDVLSNKSVSEKSYSREFEAIPECSEEFEYLMPPEDVEENIYEVLQEPSTDRHLVPLREQKPPRRSLTELYLKQLKEKSVFDTAMGKCCCSPNAAPSMLVTGFGMRNWESLQNALLADQMSRRTEEVEEEEKSQPTPVYLSSESSESTTQTTSFSDSTISMQKRKLEYLLGIDVVGEEYQEPLRKEEGMDVEEGVNYITGRTESMRRAQRYLRSHKIFEFFQFLVTHLISAMPENPIEFLLQLLDKLLLYRSGIGTPAVLYEKKHLEQFFNLMDRMKTGFIELSQYTTGMKTLGICIYAKKPPLSDDCMVSKEYFVDEAYECQIDILNDLIYSQRIKSTPQLVTPPPSKVGDLGKDSMQSFGSPYLVNPSFYNFLTRTKDAKDQGPVSRVVDIVGEDEYYQ